MPQHHGKRFKKLAAEFDSKQTYTAPDAVSLVKKNANAKFNETVEAHIRLGVDPKKSDQNVRGTVLLPHGTGRVHGVGGITAAAPLTSIVAT